MPIRQIAEKEVPRIGAGSALSPVDAIFRALVSTIVPEVDLSGGVVRIDPPPGLLDPEAAL